MKLEEYKNTMEALLEAKEKFDAESANNLASRYAEVISKQIDYIKFKMGKDYPAEADPFAEMFEGFPEPEQITEDEELILEEALRFAKTL